MFAGALLSGYLIAALVLFCAPLFASTKIVPRVLDLPVSEAEQTLEQVALRGRETERISHPTAARGTVVWQDPPQGVVVTEGATVDLSVSEGPQRVPVPDVAGYTADLARTLIESAGLELGSVASAQTSAPRGVAVNTRPPAGATMLPGTPITLVVSVGAPTISVPNLLGLTLDEARDSLEHTGLVLGTYFARASSVHDVGSVIEQRPRGGTLSAPGTAIDVILARQPR